MTTRRTLKGFTIPPGYTLNITKEDGEVVTKQAGEQSGSHYSFQEVLEGVDPDWELVEVHSYSDSSQQQFDESLYPDGIKETLSTGRYVVTSVEVDHSGYSDAENRVSFRPVGVENWDQTYGMYAVKDGQITDYRAPTWVNPDMATVTEKEEMQLPDGSTMVSSKVELKEGFSEHIPFEQDDTLMYRGMSYEELQNILSRGYIQSDGGYNMQGQEGLTYYSAEIQPAEYYAHAYAPDQYKAVPGKPAVVIAVPKREGIKVQGTAAHEIGIPDQISIEDIKHVWIGTPYSATEGDSTSGPSIGVAWSESKLSDHSGASVMQSGVESDAGWENLTVQDLHEALSTTPTRMRDANLIRNRDYYDKGLSEEVVELLDGLSNKDLFKLSKLPFSKEGRLKELTADFIIDQGFDHVSAEESMDDYELVEEAITTQTLAEVPSVGRAVSAALIEYYSISDRARREHFPYGPSSVIDLAVELMSHNDNVDASHVYDLSDAMEPYLDSEDLPTIEAPEDLLSALSEYRNPDNVVRILANIDAPDIGEDVLMWGVNFDTEKNPQEMVDQAWERYNNPYSTAFRNHILQETEHMDWEEEFDNCFEKPMSEYLDKAGFTEQQLEGAMFAFSFVHQEFYDNVKTKTGIRRLRGDARAFADADGTTINMTTKHTPGLFAHEVGHIIESHNREEMIGLNTLPYLMTRVQGDDKATAVAHNDRGIEAGYRDMFRNPYTGKLYYHVESNTGAPVGQGKELDEEGVYFGDLVRGNRFYATEVLSMGLQMMYDNPIGFARDDPSFFKHIWKMRVNPRLLAKKE